MEIVKCQPIARLFSLSISEQLPRVSLDNDVFAVESELIGIYTTCNVQRNIKQNKSSGSDNTPVWVLNDHAPPLTAICISSLREGKLPN